MTILTDASILNICSVEELMALRQIGDVDGLVVDFARAIIDADRAQHQSEQEHDWSNAHQPSFLQSTAVEQRQSEQLCHSQTPKSTPQTSLSRTDATQVEQEPVAYANANQLATRTGGLPTMDWHQTGYCTVPLFAAPQPTVDAKTLATWEQGYKRYETARKLNPSEWSRLHSLNLSGEDFDSMIDVLIHTIKGATHD